jgi:hypothetical protein
MTALLASLLFSAGLSADPQFDGVVRIHFDESAVPNLSVVRDTYTGSAPTIYAHVVIDSLTTGVSGYHLAYDIVSEDSSVVVLGGFHPSQGWSVLDPQADFPAASAWHASQTPVSVGYWVLWLKKGRASRGYIRPEPIQSGSRWSLNLHGPSGDVLSAARIYHGGIHEPPPFYTSLETSPEILLSDWMGLPVLDAVWDVQVDGDSCRVLHTEEPGGGAKAFKQSEFPVRFVQVAKTYTVPDNRFGEAPAHASAYIDVRADGALQATRIRWDHPPRIPGIGEEVGRSVTGELALFTHDGRTDVLGAEGVPVAEIPEKIKWSLCFDIPRRLAAVGTQTLKIGGERRQLSRLLLLDFEGRVVYEGAWTECTIGAVGMGQNPDVVKYSLEGCAGEGEYLLRVDEKNVYSLRSLPRTGKCFSPDSRSVLVNSGGEFSYYDARDPESLRLLWRRRVDGVVRDVAISDGGRFVAYRLSGGSDRYSHVYVLSGRDGAPVCRLLEKSEEPAAGPLGFTGSYLFVGMGFNLGATAWQTTFIRVFDLGAMGR